jgi:hypothetical protein
VIVSENDGDAALPLATNARFWTDPRDQQVWELWATRTVQLSVDAASGQHIGRIQWVLQFLSGWEHAHLKVAPEIAVNLAALQDVLIAQLLDLGRRSFETDDRR